MGFILSLVFITICIISVIRKNYKLNIFISIFSIVCDTFYFKIGGLNFLLIYFIGYLNIPYIIKSGIIRNNNTHRLIKYFKAEYIYLILLGIVFGFLFPWEDISGTRLWNQTAQGRTIVQLLRLLNEFIVLYYITYLILSKKTNIRFIIISFAIASVISFWVGFIDYFLGYPIKNALFDLGHFESTRFLGLNGEPKALGRAGALSYALIMLYILYFRDKTVFLVFALITNVLAVIFSSSASSYILFLLLNLIILSNINIKSILLVPVVLFGLFFTYNFLQTNGYLQEQTDTKINKALFGHDEKWVANEPQIFSRFDIFDRLALIYLWQHPVYLVTGVGPNLISIPMSANIPTSSTFYTLGRVDSVPNVMFNNILSRSGLIGVCLFIFGISSILTNSKKQLSLFYFKLILCIIVFNLVYFNVTFYFVIGILIGTLVLKGEEICSRN